MGRSDKPIDIASYSYLGHHDRLLRFIEELDLQEINLFVQDWGSLIGLRVAGLNPDRFARIANVRLTCEKRSVFLLARSASTSTSSRGRIACGARLDVFADQFLDPVMSVA